jgi:4-amino-4-deoxy-L-arabinose transferase-like glycosyltransferase
LGKEIFSNRIGIIAAAIGTFYYPFIQMSAYLVTETVSIFLIIFSLWWIIKFEETLPAGCFLLGGILLGIAGLSRSTFFGFYPILLMILMLTFSNKKVGLRISFYTLLGILLIISPWVTRNYIQFNKIIPISTRSGFILYQGNNPVAKAASGGWWPVGKEYIIPEEVFSMTEIERNSYLGKQAKNFIINHPKTFINLFIRKIVNMWRPYYSGISSLSKLVMLLSYIPVILFGLTGMLWSYKKWKKSAILIFFILYYVFVHAILVSTIRYRWPVMPFFFIFSAFAINKFTQKFQINS